MLNNISTSIEFRAPIGDYLHVPRRQISLAVVGADYPNKRGPTRRFAIALLRPGDPVDLVPELKNPFDPRAIAVHDRSGVQLGYIQAERAQLIGQMLQRQLVAVFQEPASYGAIIRIAVDGETPTLPPPRPPETPPDEEFWADPIYDD